MAAGPIARDHADGGRDHVFLSYSHVDAQWAQRVRVLLKPLLRQERLRMWVDTDMRAGSAWQAEIMRGIARSRVAMLLVSADFLDSDFIMETEVPALIESGVTLAPVLVGECLWRLVPELERVQWLHDPGDGALSLTSDQVGERDRRLRRVCERLLEVMPLRAADVAVAGVAPAADASVSANTVFAVPPGSLRGALSGVPELPPGYVVRDELAGLVEAVAAVDGGVVGVTGDAPVGLHGQGGIGKSVVAAALARDDGIGHRFPDGVYWVTVGERPDVLGVQLELLGRLGTRGAAPRTIPDATAELTRVLDTRRVLLVVDDVWSTRAAEALRVTGPRGRVVYTSRDPQVLAAAGARPHRIDVLSAATARALGAGVIGVAPEALPRAADRVFAEVGHVALAVSLLAAAVRGGRSWSQVAADLDRDETVFGSHPYANTFKAMQIAVEALSAGLGDALLSLAVFPPDASIPAAAVDRYWAHTRGLSAADTRADLDRLAEANVLTVEETTIGFHDLQHDYLLLHAPLIAELHGTLLAAYRALLPAGGDQGWWQLPVGEAYIGNHLVRHLRGSGDHAALAATVTDPAYLARRIAAGGPHAAEADLAQAAIALPTDAAIGWWRGWIARHANLLTARESSGGSLSTATPTAAMFVRLAADPTCREHHVDPDRLTLLLPRPHIRALWGLTPPPPALIRVMTGHTDWVRSVRWSPDGTRLVSGGDDGTVRVWDAASGEQLDVPAGRHADWVWSVAWSPDGTRLASAGGDGAVRVWDAVSGEPVGTLKVRSGGLYTVAWSPDGSRLAGAGSDMDMRVWDVASGAVIRGHKDHFGGVWSVAWSPDGSRLASAGDDRLVRVWEPYGSASPLPFTMDGSSLRSVSWSPDGTRLAAAGWSVLVLTVGSAELRRLENRVERIEAVAWSPDGTRLAGAGAGGTVEVWDEVSGTSLLTLTGHGDGVRAVDWSPDGTQLVSAGDDGTVRVWQTTVDPLPSAAGGDRDRGVRSVRWSPDESRLIGAGADGTVRVWDAVTGEPLHRLQVQVDDVRSVAWSPDGTRLVSAGTRGLIRVRDATTGELVATFAGHDGPVAAVGWSPDGTRLVSAGEDRTVRLWSTGPRQRNWRKRPVSVRPLVLKGHTGPVQSVAWSPDATRVASAAGDGTVRIWDGTGGQALVVLTGHTDDARSVAWSPDGTRLGTVGGDGTIRVWAADSGAELRAWKAGDGGLSSVAWSPDGIHLASTSDDGVLTVRDVVRPDDPPVHLFFTPLTDLSWAASGIAVAGTTGLFVLEVRP